MKWRPRRTLVLGFVGKAGVGKSTTAKLVELIIKTYGDFEVITVPFAKPLKDIATMMGWNGKKDDKGRRLLQLLGTECGRECISPTIWIDKWKNIIREVANDGKPKPLIVLTDDVRFPNEVEAVKEQGGTIIRILAPEGEKTGLEGAAANHASETHMSTLAADIEWVNDYKGRTRLENLESLMGVLDNIHSVSALKKMYGEDA